MLCVLLRWWRCALKYRGVLCDSEACFRHLTQVKQSGGVSESPGICDTLKMLHLYTWKRTNRAVL